MNWFLGMQVIQSDKTISVNQNLYIIKVLERFNMSDCNPISSPADNNASLTKACCPVLDSPERQNKCLRFTINTGRL